MTDCNPSPSHQGERLAKTNVIILTYRWPFTEKAEFMRDEWSAWTAAKRVTIIGLAASQKQSLQLSENCVAHAVSPIRTTWDRIRYLLVSLARFPVVAELQRILRCGPVGFLARLRTLAVHLQAAERYRVALAQALAECSPADDESVVIYSYWFGAATHAAVLAKKSLPGPQSIAITRAHGTDLYEHANLGSYLPFRRDLAAQVEGIYAISKNGRDYAVQHWDVMPQKAHVARLGTVDIFSGRFPARQPRVTVLSCSYISHLKRVDLIAEAVSRLKAPQVHWIHIGGGSGEPQLRRHCESLFRGREGLTFELCGNLPHEKTIALIQQTNINVLVNASTSEGIPVSMMEAHCCGIPVVGPNVGGVSEIIDSGINGCLLQPPISPDTVAAAIQGLIDMPWADYERLCRQARSSWESRFCATTNYPAFADSVAGLLRNTLSPLDDE